MLDRARTQRQDVAARRASLAAQAEFADEPGRRFVPTLKLDAQYRVASAAGQGGRYDDGQIGLTLSWPLFDGFERDADAAERQATLREQSALADAQLRSVDRDVRLANETIETQRAQLVAARAAEQAAARNANEAAELLRQGLGTAFELADAQARQFDAEVGRTRAELGLAAARLQLQMALGEWPAGLTDGKSP